MADIERPGGDETPRDRVLTAKEIGIFWEKLDTAEMAEPTHLALKFLLMTAQRRGELNFARWAHFDLPAKTWAIPVELLKSSHSRREKAEPHVVPLSPLAMDLLENLRALTGVSAYVPPAQASKMATKSYTERMLSRAVRENCKHFGIPYFTPRDLR